MADRTGGERRKGVESRRKKDGDRRKGSEESVWLGPMLERRKKRKQRREKAAGRRKTDKS